MTTRRHMLLSAAASAAALSTGIFHRSATAASESIEISYTDAQWRARLSPQQYAVLRQEATEPPGSSPLNKEHRPGIFSCAGCSLPLFASTTKFDSGTGWPSFWKPLDNAVATRKDRSYGMVRVEAHCRRCGGHLGHVFEDGPPPTGLRYCMNGLALTFAPKPA
ncbi:peptide-methionine (R)-S-oxide reductase MsrB [Comamonas testosteroni]|uniref:peptide-methionine (R)-S-oxide reductase n=1 Tax=Comamonas testosteroni TaxID=285 RepID=A0A8B4S6J1_COMTE|nr:peptide-methionine (R)-S-oxide reductase MsrB [Comamonas testosteroni]EHN65808.1 methionine-R-sulfoxide reductase [Comamonas testosteroni ATCC 11996]QQN68561.1 peptide-methionine (R)-S-oxide reductase MsrB [Comamonas testosteroni]SUY78168.1 Peptide methionine sulfoxide reductase MsrB [Comamonas testosteroni]